MIVEDQWSLLWNAVDHTWSVLITASYHEPYRGECHIWICRSDCHTAHQHLSCAIAQNHHKLELTFSLICSNLSPHAIILRIVGQRLSSLLLICLWHESSSVESHWRMSTCQLSIFLKSFCASEATFFTNHNDSYFAFSTHDVTSYSISRKTF